MTGLERFIAISKYAGQRFDLVQASGGNSSVKKDDGTMYIKASGYELSEVSFDKGHSLVRNKKILRLLDDSKLCSMSDIKKRDACILEGIQQSVAGSGERPSIEVFLHALFDTYTLHTHPIAVNALTCQRNWQEIAGELIKDALLVPYKAPGIELAAELKKRIDGFRAENGRTPGVVLLQNHGLIVTSDVFEQIEVTTEKVLEEIEGHFGFDLSKYKLATMVSRMLNRVKNQYSAAYRSDDALINALLKMKKDELYAKLLCPDTAVFCGASALKIDNLEDTGAIEVFYKEYGELPRIIVYQDNIFFIAQNIKQAREIEEVFKAHLLTRSLVKDIVYYLSDMDAEYLGIWEAERYRRRS